jgi:hypothetical protein
VLVAIAGAACGCSERPLGSTTGCEASDTTAAFSLCGAIAGKPVSYAPDLQFYAHGNSALEYEVMAREGRPWLDIWGTGSTSDHEPHPITGWLLRPPADWAADGTWFCGQGDTVTRHEDLSVDATLTAPSILPACGVAGGPDVLHVDIHGGISRFDGGCMIGFSSITDDARNRVIIFPPTCPELGVPLPLDGLRIVDHTETTGAASAATRCVGAGASLTWVPDDTTTASHFIVDIPSMSARETCAPPVSGELQMKIAAPATNP